MKKMFGNKILFNTLLVFTLLLGFVFAAHQVFISTGESSFNFNEKVTALYNISINNTDAGQTANITQVNITLPSEIVFDNGTNATNTPFVTFVNTSTVLSWENSTGYLINGSVNNSVFSFNATASTPGTYNITVTTTNSTSSYSSNISVTINDTTAPNVTINLPINTTYSGTTITFNVTTTDNIGISACWFTINSGVTNYTMTNTSASNFNYTLSSSDSSYTVIYYCNDTSNNINNSMNVSFTLYNAPAAEEETGDGGTYIPPFWTNTEVITDEQFKQGITKELPVKSRIKLKINNIDHYIGIKKLTTTEVTIEIASIPRNATLSVGEEEMFDVTGDGYYDIYVKLNSISNNKAEITIQSIYLKITDDVIVEEDETVVGEEKQDEGELGGSKTTTWIIVVIIIIVLAGIGYIIKKKK